MTSAAEYKTPRTKTFSTFIAIKVIFKAHSKDTVLFLIVVLCCFFIIFFIEPL